MSTGRNALPEDICCAEDAVFIVQNYCDHPCANFYIFNERRNCRFQNRPDRLQQYLMIRKKFIVISSTECDSFMRAFQQYTEDAPEILYMNEKNYGFSSSTKDLLQSELARSEIRGFLKYMPEGG